MTENNENIYSDDSDLAVVDTKEIDETNEEKDLREKTKKFSQAADAAFLSLAGCLYDIKKGSIYGKWGFGTFAEYIEGELSCSIRKAEYLMKIWEYFVVKQQIIDKVKHIGFTKLRECVEFITKENLEDVLPKIEPMPVSKLLEWKKEIKKKQDTKNVPPTKEELEIDPVEKPHKMSFKLYSEQYKTVNDALEQAGELGDTKCKNQQLKYVSNEFLSTVSKATTGMEHMIASATRFEEQFNVKILVIDKEKKEILYGEDIENVLGDGSEDEESGDK